MYNRISVLEQPVGLPRSQMCSRILLFTSPLQFPITCRTVHHPVSILTFLSCCPPRKDFVSTFASHLFRALMFHDLALLSTRSFTQKYLVLIWRVFSAANRPRVFSAIQLKSSWYSPTGFMSYPWATSRFHTFNPWLHDYDSTTSSASVEDLVTILRILL